MKKLGDIEVYYSYPENKSTEYGILILTDVIGHSFINAQLIVGELNDTLSPQLPIYDTYKPPS